MSQVVNAVRNGPFWQDSVIFITYDEHGGYYDHVAPPKARQGGARMPRRSVRLSQRTRQDRIPRSAAALTNWDSVSR